MKKTALPMFFFSFFCVLYDQDSRSVTPRHLPPKHCHSFSKRPNCFLIGEYLKVSCCQAYWFLGLFVTLQQTLFIIICTWLLKKKENYLIVFKILELLCMDSGWPRPLSCSGTSPPDTPLCLHPLSLSSIRSHGPASGYSNHKKTIVQLTNAVTRTLGRYLISYSTLTETRTPRHVLFNSFYLVRPNKRNIYNL
jgi:hypothetical protein